MKTKLKDGTYIVVKDRHLCYGGCPITPSINLCDREERSY